MDFLDWCSLVLKKLIEAGRSPHLDEIRLAQLLYGEEFRATSGFHHSTHRHGMFDAVKELVNLGLVEERRGPFWTVMPEGREFDANPAPLLRQIRAVALEPDEKRILLVVNALSPQAGLDPPHAWLEWVKRDPLLAEYGITAGFDMQEILWPISEDLERRGLVYRRALPGWHLDLKPTYNGLAWERRPAQVSEPEMGHVLFLDIVGYSKLLMEQQTETLEQLNEIVRGTDEYRRASSESNSLIKLPTGDGMALVFFHGLTSHVRCAIELNQALRKYPDLKLRTGLHSGPVYRVSDINDSRNVAGGGINIAQRVMDCGDAGHILLSKAVADNLQQLGGWEGKFQDLGEVEVKHGVKVHIYNFVDGELGNPVIPAKVEAQRNAVREVSHVRFAESHPQIVQHYYGQVGAVQNAEKSSAFVKQGSGREGDQLDKNLIDLLLRISSGERFFRPENDNSEAKDAFVPVVRRLKELSQQGLIEPLTDRRIIKDHTTGKGHFNIVGPCEITYAGEQAITKYEDAVALQESDTGNNLTNPKNGAINVARQNRPDAIQKRLHDLSDNITEDYALLKEYEDNLRLEDDPRRRARNQREIDRLKTSASAYEREYKELELQFAGRSVEASQSERSELQQIHVKLDALLGGQSDINLSLYNLRQAILSRYEASEQRIINSITERLDQVQAETVQTMLEAVDKDQLNEAEMAEAISAVQQALVEVKQRGAALAEHAELEETISAPHLDVKHKLKFSIPIVPLLLEYEGEVELGSGLNLESVWNRLVNKFRRK
jgi:class 3 adenylate cyclase